MRLTPRERRRYGGVVSIRVELDAVVAEVGRWGFGFGHRFLIYRIRYHRVRLI